MSATTEKIRLGPGEHGVRFYEDDAELAAIVGGHIADALDEDAAVVVIATDAHVRAFERELTASGVDVEEARDSGSLILFDAPETLSKLMVDGRIDRSAFQRVIGTVVREAAAAGQPVRAYGEMVDLLWRAGDVGGAIQLETLWNELIEELRFSLLCAYHSEALADPEHEHAVLEVCRLHSSVSRAAASPVPATRKVSRKFEPRSDAPRAARHFVEEALRAWGYADRQLEDARLLLSELVTNAVIHARSPFSVSVRSENLRLRLAVHDHSPTEPRLRLAAPEAGSGRGLQLVAMLSKDWGVVGTPIGKTVWAEL
jgi:MEDS: MEthanogen/methylotroph, DcmR Sensory domain/Histidine kinase-like ATPase domain